MLAAGGATDVVRVNGLDWFVAGGTTAVRQLRAALESGVRRLARASLRLRNMLSPDAAPGSMLILDAAVPGTCSFLGSKRGHNAAMSIRPLSFVEILSVLYQWM